MKGKKVSLGTKEQHNLDRGGHVGGAGKTCRKWVIRGSKVDDRLQTNETPHSFLKKEGTEEKGGPWKTSL